VKLLYSPDGTLAFTTGAYTSVGSNATTWSFLGGGAGSITIGGTIPAQGTFGGDTPGPQLSGAIQSAIVTASGNNFNVAIGMFINTIDPALAAYYGEPTTGWFGFFDIGFQAVASDSSPSTGTGWGSSTSVSSGDVLTSSVPEPSSVVLAGLGALGAIGYGLRLRKALGA
jgi:hypothetical protein